DKQFRLAPARDLERCGKRLVHRDRRLHDPSDSAFRAMHDQRNVFADQRGTATRYAGGRRQRPEQSAETAERAAYGVWNWAADTDTYSRPYAASHLLSLRPPFRAQGA